jgi:tetratricopeptide (TPR) repeat protein
MRISGADRPTLLLWVVVAGSMTGCQLLPGSSGEKAAPASAAGPVSEGRRLADQGQLDAALAKLQEAPNDPESLYLQGVVWAKKAELAPAPEAPEEGGSPPEFKVEERNALAFFETLIEAMPNRAEAHLAAAELLAPHAVARARRKRAPEASGEPGEPDFSPARVMAAYRKAAELGEGPEAVEGMIEFCKQLEDLDCVGDGFLHLIERDPESANPRIRYGDYLMERRQVDEAARQYDIALVWAPEDEVTRGKLATIYIDQGTRHLKAREWALAEEALQRAGDYIKDQRSEQARLLRERREELASRSGRR